MTAYNGWTNRETWGCALIFDNDHSYNTYIKEVLEGCKEDGLDYNQALYRLIDAIREQVEYEWEEVQINSYLMQQLIDFPGDRINYSEVAESFLEDYPRSSPNRRPARKPATKKPATKKPAASKPKAKSTAKPKASTNKAPAKKPTTRRH